jgi:hypothetical protein
MTRGEKLVGMAQGRAGMELHNALTKHSSSPFTRRTRNRCSHLEVSDATGFSDDNASPGRVSRWPERCGVRRVETRVRHCSLVVLDDTEAHYLRPLLTIQPSSRFRFRSFS